MRWSNTVHRRAVLNRQLHYDFAVIPITPWLATYTEIVQRLTHPSKVIMSHFDISTAGESALMTIATELDERSDVPVAPLARQDEEGPRYAGCTTPDGRGVRRLRFGCSAKLTSPVTKPDILLEGPI